MIDTIHLEFKRASGSLHCKQEIENRGVGYRDVGSEPEARAR